MRICIYRLVAKIININPTYLLYIYLLILTTSGRVARGFKKSSSLKKARV